MKKPIQFLMFAAYVAAFALLPVACTEADHNHGHDHAHDDHDHHDHDHDDHDHAEGEDHDHAHGDHEHHEPQVAGPNLGRVLESEDPRVEFFVTADRHVQVTRLDEKIEAIPLGGLEVTVIGGDRTNPTRMKFAKKGEVLLSDIPFPEGNDFPVVVQIKGSAGGETITEKFNLNLADCPTCDSKEYACTCEH